MAGSIPYVSTPYEPRLAYDRSPMVGQMADLIRYQGESAAEAVRRRGAIQAKYGDVAAQQWGNIGQSIAGLGGAIGKYVTEAPERKWQEERRQFEREKMTQERGSMARLAKLEDIKARVGRQGPEALAKALDEAGLTDDAAKTRDDFVKQQTNQFQLKSAEYGDLSRRRNDAARAVRAVIDFAESDAAKDETDPTGKKVDPNKVAALHTQALADARRLVGADADLLPTTYDPAVMKRIADSWTTAADLHNFESIAASRAQRALAAEKGSWEKAQTSYEMLVNAYAGANTPAKWQGVFNLREKAPPEIQAMFDEEFSEDGYEHAKDMAQRLNQKGPEDPYREARRLWQEEHPGKKMKTEDYYSIIGRVHQEEDRYRYRPNTSGDVTTAQQGVIERWNRETLDKIEEIYRESQKNPPGPKRLTREWLEDQKNQTHIATNKMYGIRNPMSLHDYNRSIGKKEWWTEPVAGQQGGEMPGAMPGGFDTSVPAPPSVADLAAARTPRVPPPIPPRGPMPGVAAAIDSALAQRPVSDAALDAALAAEGSPARASTFGQPPAAPPTAPAQEAAPAAAPPRKSVTLSGKTFYVGDVIRNKKGERVVIIDVKDGKPVVEPAVGPK